MTSMSAVSSLPNDIEMQVIVEGNFLDPAPEPVQDVRVEDEERFPQRNPCCEKIVIVAACVVCVAIPVIFILGDVLGTALGCGSIPIDHSIPSEAQQRKAQTCVVTGYRIVGHAPIYSCSPPLRIQRRQFCYELAGSLLSIAATVSILVFLACCCCSVILYNNKKKH